MLAGGGCGVVAKHDGGGAYEGGVDGGVEAVAAVEGVAAGTGAGVAGAPRPSPTSYTSTTSSSTAAPPRAPARPPVEALDTRRRAVTRHALGDAAGARQVAERRRPLLSVARVHPDEGLRHSGRRRAGGAIGARQRVLGRPRGVRAVCGIRIRHA